MGAPTAFSFNTSLRAARPTGRAAFIVALEPVCFRLQPALFAGLLLTLGIALSHFVWIAPAWLLFSGLLPTGLLAGLTRWRSRMAILPLLAFWMLLGFFSAEVQPRSEPKRQLNAFSDGAPHVVKGGIVRYGAVRRVESLRPFSNERKPEQDVAIQVAIRSVDGVLLRDGSNREGAGMRLTLYAPASMQIARVHCGDEMTVETVLKQPQQYRDPGVWDAREWLAGEGISVTGSADARFILLPVHTGRGSMACRVHALQTMASSRILQIGQDERPAWLPWWFVLTEDDASMVTAMVTGDRSYLERGERQGFERTGSFHVLVVSGLHVGLIAALVFAAARRSRGSRFVATMLTAGATSVYAVFTGFGAPVQRALWMVLLYLAARLIFREKHALQAVGVAALCLLAWDPRALFDAGFQMTILTVIATGGLVAPIVERSFGPYLAASRRIWLVAIDHSLPPRLAQFRVMLRMYAEQLAPLLPLRQSADDTARKMAWLVHFSLRMLELVTVSAIVEIVMSLPMAMYFHRATVLALPVNLLLIPMLGLLLPAALVTAATALVSPHAALVPAALLAALLHLAVGFVHFFASIRAGDVRVATPGLWVAPGVVVTLGISVWSMHQRRAVAGFAMLAMLAAAAWIVLPHAALRRNKVLEVAALDVGQGDALLVVTPDGKTMMVDCGGPTGGDLAQHGNFEIGEDVVSPALWTRGISRLDVVALTHAHSDHMGGMFAVLRNFHPRELWVGNNPATHDYEALLDEAKSLGIRVRSFHQGNEFAFGGTDVRVLAPGIDYRPEATAKNDDSLVMRIAFGKTSVLLEGDAEASSEAIMSSLPSIHSDVLKVGHHGSRTSTTADFLKAVSPRYAVVSVGLHNLYHHPRFETLELLEEAGAVTYRTDLDGMSTFYLDGEHVRTSP